MATISPTLDGKLLGKKTMLMRISSIALPEV